MDNVTDSYVVGKNSNILYLWTECGASRHAKILDTDKAWEIYDLLEEFYFNYEKFQWNKARADSKISNKNFKDAVKKFYEYAKSQGTSRPEVAFYSKFSKLANVAAGIKNKKDRDNASVSQLNALNLIENGIANILIVGMENKFPYKEIEVKVETWIKNFAEIFQVSMSVEGATLKLLNSSPNQYCRSKLP